MTTSSNFIDVGLLIDQYNVLIDVNERTIFFCAYVCVSATTYNVYINAQKTIIESQSMVHYAAVTSIVSMWWIT